MKHTPGPWESFGHEVFAQARHGVMLIAKASEIYIGPWRGQGEANARLIAAAPEMFALIEDLHDEIDQGGDFDYHLGELGYAERVKTIVAKVKGEQP